jgi:hypothetical protein
MSAQHGKENTEPDNANVGLVATVTVVGAFVVISITTAMTALVRHESSQYGDEIGAYANLGTVRRLKAEQAAKLTAEPGWSDKSKGLYSVPIDRAMNLVTTEVQKNPNLATPMPPTPPQAAAPAGAEVAAPTGPAGQASPSEAEKSTGSAEQKTDKPEKKDGKTGADKKPLRGALPVDPQKGAPVAPASAPAPHG